MSDRRTRPDLPDGSGWSKLELMFLHLRRKHGYLGGREMKTLDRYQKRLGLAEARPAELTKSDHPKQSCEHCGTPMITKRNTGRFCSVKCRVASHRQKAA